MKISGNKKNVLLILFLFMGIGFAILSSNLQFRGDFSFKENTWDVHFEDIKVNIDSVTGEAIIDNSNKTTINFGGVFAEPGDFFEFSVNIVNAGSLDAVLDEILKVGLSNENANYIDYITTYYSGNNLAENDILRAGYSSKINVRVEYKYDVDEIPDISELNLSLTLNYVKVNLESDFYNKYVWDFDYAEEMQTFTAPLTGTYKIETWGAQGGTAILDDTTIPGGYGGYSVGNVSLNKDDKYYLAVGGKGLGDTETDLLGGYNGGGSTSASTNVGFNSSGGGATAIYSSGNVTFCLGTEVANRNIYDSASNGVYLTDDEISIDGNSIVLNSSNNYNFFQCGNNAGRTIGEYFKVEWRGSGLSDSKIVYDGGYYKEGESSFRRNQGINIYAKRVTDNLVEVWYKITENSTKTEFRLQTNGAHITLDSKTVIKLNSPIIVSGGGGGTHLHPGGKSYGGSGGGYIGSSPVNIYQSMSYCSPGTGGTQNSGGNFASCTWKSGFITTFGSNGYMGKGGDYMNAHYGAGGGGGYYGGGSGNNGDSCAYSGAGGSGYIGNVLLSDKAMYCYNCSESNDESTKTISTTNVSETPISQYSKMGHGHIRITFLAN